MPDSSNLLVAGSGSIRTAPVGTTAPTDTTTAWAAGWVDLGFVTDDGLSLTRDVNKVDKYAWQSLAVIRSIYTSVALTFAFSLSEWNADTVPLAFGGGSWVASGAESKYEFPANPNAVERAFGFEWIDAATGVKNRLIVPRAQATASGDIKLVGTDTAVIPVTLSVLATDVSSPLATLISNADGLTA